MEAPFAEARPTTDSEFYLARLRRFTRLIGVADAAHLPHWRQLARRAAFAAYLDCAALGRADAARAIVAARRDGEEHFPSAGVSQKTPVAVPVAVRRAQPARGR
jgi:hypothetical protein